MLADDYLKSDLDLLIVRALVNGGRAWNALDAHARRYAKPILRAKAGDLPADLHDDVVQQALLNLHRTGPQRLDPDKGRPSTLFRWCVREAIRQVRAAMAPPGSVTRKRGKVEKRSAEIVAFSDATEAEAARATIAAVSVVEARIDAETILRRAPAPVAHALELIHCDDGTLAAAAEMVALSRFQLSRRMFAYSMELRAAA